ncbi:MAG: type II toxin-antitoxin system HicB family antitoxin [Alphaproteobacteria bacterium]|nr:type II toxin-antitoxin system HicB family antitoxin [Alphaproteobacteria bacterium]MDP6564562.1 type II toxin-antitoxin system HicB family antitoxin [Alphaproteobacteria bacterium]MDP6811920.1 type II toxin-antitoxin system HicB family antitoxin [Alphaproteobacteria bacterium]
MRDLPGAVTDGADRSEALREAADALEEAIAACMAGHEDIPRPSPARGRAIVVPGTLIAAKAALYEAMREKGVGNVELGRRLGVAETEIRRCIDPRHATRISRLDAALAALGRRLIVTVDAA